MHPGPRHLLAALLAVLAARAVWRDGWRLAEHDLIDHPLMALVPPVGTWLHDRRARLLASP